MNTTDFSALHDIAMEFAEEAHFAKKRGEEQTAKLFYQKAFNLEKSYALSFPEKPAYLLSRAVFIRSAAHLALNSGYFIEAINLATFGLENTPHPDFISEFQEIIKKGKHHNVPTIKEITINGILTFADLSKKQIKIKEIHSERIYTLLVTDISLEELVMTFWAKTVAVKGITNKSGVIQLADIKRAT